MSVMSSLMIIGIKCWISIFHSSTIFSLETVCLVRINKIGKKTFLANTQEMNETALILVNLIIYFISHFYNF
jgi:hypothetical protein